MDPQAVPLRDWLADRFDAIDNRLENLEKVLVIGNGTPAVTQRLATAESQIKTHNVLLAYDRQQIDALRTAPKTEQRKLGISLSGLSAIIAAIVAGIISGTN